MSSVAFTTLISGLYLPNKKGETKLYDTFREFKVEESKDGKQNASLKALNGLLQAEAIFTL